LDNDWRKFWQQKDEISLALRKEETREEESFRKDELIGGGVRELTWKQGPIAIGNGEPVEKLTP